MKGSKAQWFLIIIFIISLSLIVGCEKPPTKEMESAEKAIADAKQKEADLYVKDVFGKAESALKKAKEMVTAKNYKEAKASAEEALKLAQQATQAVEQNKAKMKADTEQLIIDTQNLINDAKTLVSQAIRKKIQIDKAEIQNAIGKWEVEMTSAKENLQAGKIRSAFDQVTSINAEAKGIKEKLVALLEPKAAEKKQ
ncbi:MAG: hypothetical protein N2511_05085 [Thermodesulfovibrionales bacterium]|nr:hypothetical protein [Thermodesulfovibrionales bacterium]